MDILKNNIELETEIKKSKFITKLYRVDTMDEIKTILDNLRQEYYDATHICYAYILEGQMKCSDDNEPSGTAGYPILQVIEKQNLDHILAVVIRYFGGIKLGAGGLTRAYSNSVRDALLQKEIISLTDGYLVEIETTYDKAKQLDYILKDVKDVEKKYQENVLYSIKIKKEFLEQLKEYKYNIISDIKVEK